MPEKCGSVDMDAMMRQVENEITTSPILRVHEVSVKADELFGVRNVIALIYISKGNVSGMHAMIPFIETLSEASRIAEKFEGVSSIHYRSENGKVVIYLAILVPCD